MRTFYFRVVSTAAEVIPMKSPKIRQFAGRHLVIALSLGGASPLSAAQVDIAGPPASTFGYEVHVLPNGNFVVVAPSGPGSVSLYDPAGELISRLTGSRYADEVGSNGVEILTNGNFVVCSPHWSTATAQYVGAVTWINGTTGLNGVVSASNSLVGSNTNDFVGSEDGASGSGKGAYALANGNYVIRSANWDRPGVAYDAGAITWGNGATGTVGPVSAANSLVGNRSNEKLGRLPSPITLLTNGNYVVTSRYSLASNGTVTGAVAWGNGLGGTTGGISESNALYGTTVDATVTALTNGNYVICSPQWSDGITTNLGAATWGNGSTGIQGTVSPENSLVGTQAYDEVGFYGVQPLTNGNFVVKSGRWNNYRGAATFGNGNTGITGAVSAANSLVGRVRDDGLPMSVAALTNGNYVVASPSWKSDSGQNGFGAITWANGMTGVCGEISAANSMVGRFSMDKVGSGGVVPLLNGNYVVNSPDWRQSDPDGSFGAVTFCLGDRQTLGTISAENSLTGSAIGDYVGSGGVKALANGNYVVGSPAWHRNGITDVGAVTWGSGVTGLIGPVSIANSLTGSANGHQVGKRLTALTNGSYVVSSPFWSRPEFTECGAITWCDGNAPFVGTVTIENSLVGASSNEYLGGRNSETVSPTPDGNYFVGSPDFSLPGLADVGATALRSGSSGQGGIIGPETAVIGSIVDRGFWQRAAYDPKHRQLVVGHGLLNKVTIFHYPMAAPVEFNFGDGTRLIARLRGESGKRYAVQRSTDLGEWTVKNQATASVSGIVYHEEENPTSSAFYRLVESIAE
jgi:hypothetical protein